MIRHIVLFCFREDVTEKQVLLVRSAFLVIGSLIEGITRVEWGVNDSMEGKNAGMSHAVLMTFRDEESRLRYIFHPGHDALKTIFSPLLRDILVLDFTVLPENVARG